MIEVVQIHKAYNANSACYKSFARLYEYYLVSFLFSDLLSSHWLSEYSSLGALINTKYKKNNLRRKEKLCMKLRR